jgi:hypothetical protein
LFDKRPDRDRFKQADFERAMQVLFAARKIQNQPYGRSGAERFCIVRARGCVGHNGTT